MPELVTHIIVAFLIWAIFLKKEKLSIILVGAILPDIYYKLGYILRYFVGENIVLGLSVSHTFVGGLLVCLIIGPLFKGDYKKIVSLLYIGTVSHILLDITQIPGVYMLLWPFSFEFWGLNWIWPETLFPLVISSVLIGVYFIFKLRNRH